MFLSPSHCLFLIFEGAKAIECFVRLPENVIFFGHLLLPNIYSHIHVRLLNFV